MRNIAKNFIIFFLFILILMGVFSLFNTSLNKPREIDIGEMVQKVEAGEVQKIVINGEDLVITLTNGEVLHSRKEQTDSLPTLLSNYGVTPDQLKVVQIQVARESAFAFWAGAILPFLIPILLIGLFIWFMMRQVQGANTRALSFGQSSAREVRNDTNKNKVTFKDVAGVREAKSELEEVVDFLKNPRKFLALGARIPKGVLLIGAPGTGKTLLAKAVAGEADVPFFNISGSEFVEMFVGVGASRVRDLFRRAKKSAPCIVFVDEIDAVGRRRGAGLGGSHDEREQTLNQILVEMDGFDTDTNVIIMAATNRPDVLDPALLRPGRFDRRVFLDEPDIKDREAILKVHSTKKPLDTSVDLRKIAQRTPGFSGADLANLLNEAAILAAKRNKKTISLQECFDSVEKVMLGPERKSRLLNEKEKKITAYHEAGHALVAHILPHSDPVHKVSIVARGQAGGYTLKLPLEDKHMHSKADFLDNISVLLAGHAAEKEIFHDITTGASSDLKQATVLARKLVTEYGMSERLGPRTFGDHDELIFLGREITEQRDYSEKVAQAIDQEVSTFIKQSYEKARKVIRTMRPKLELIVKKLLEKETLEQEEFEALFKPQAA